MFKGSIMPNEKAAMILQSKTDMSREMIAKLSDAEAWIIIYSIRSTKAKDNRLQVCFTGFGASKKAELVKLALDNQLHVVSSVTKNLDFLCGGESSGPKKLEKAINQGVQILSENDFLNLLETGEVPLET
jgi:NAD-dependent DNA ligase